MENKRYFVYILANHNRNVLYTGVTGNLLERVQQHKDGKGSQFTRKYKCYYLMYYEEYSDPESAIQREKQIKAGSRQKKIDLINLLNPVWRDLSEDFD